MNRGVVWEWVKGRFSGWVRILCILTVVLIIGPGCTDMEAYIKETQRELEAAKQLERAEEELRRGNILSARTGFERVRREAIRTDVQQRAQFFSAFTTILDKKDKDRWERGRQMFLRTSREFPHGDLGQLSSYLAVVLSDVVDITTARKALETECAAMQKEMGTAASQNQEMNRAVRKLKNQLSKKTDEIAELQEAIQRKDEAIQSLELKIQKLEEIHKEIKEKREGLS